MSNLDNPLDVAEQGTELQPSNQPPVIRLKEHPSLSRGAWKLALVIVLVALVAGAGGIVLYKKHQHDLYLNSISPDTIFQKSLQANLSTAKFQRKAQYGRAANWLTTEYDVGNPQEAIVSSTLSAWTFGRTVGVSSYSNNSASTNSLVVSAVDPSWKGRGNLPLFSTDALYPAANQAVSLRNQGVYDSIYTAAYQKRLTDTSYDPSEDIGGYALTLHDARMDLFGPIIFGNFNQKQKDKLTELINNQSTYTYDSKKVITETINGRKTYVYTVRIDGTKLRELYQLAASYYGINWNDLKNTGVANAVKTGNYKFFIDFTNHRLVQIDDLTSSKVRHETFTYANVSPGSAPAPTISVGMYTVTLDNVCQNRRVLLAMPDSSLDTIVCDAVYNFLP